MQCEYKLLLHALPCWHWWLSYETYVWCVQSFFCCEPIPSIQDSQCLKTLQAKHRAFLITLPKKTIWQQLWGPRHAATCSRWNSSWHYRSLRKTGTVRCSSIFLLEWKDVCKGNQSFKSSDLQTQLKNRSWHPAQHPVLILFHPLQSTDPC